MKKTPKPLILLDILTVLAILGAILIVLFYTPTELEMGLVQKVFYFHVACTWVGMLGFTLAAVASIAFLKTRNMKWDSAAVAGVEIGMVFVGLGIVSGSIWAKPIWNTWWTWDPRLTTTLIMELIYVAYMILRGSVNEPGQRARFSAVYAIAGFVSVPLTFLSIRVFRTIHPVVVGAASSSGGTFAMTGQMLFTFIFCLAVFSLLFIVLFWHRYRLEQQRTEIERIMELRESVEEL